MDFGAGFPFVPVNSNVGNANANNGLWNCNANNDWTNTNSARNC